MMMMMMMMKLLLMTRTMMIKLMMTYVLDTMTWRVNDAAANAVEDGDMLMMEMTLMPVMIIGSHKQRRRRGRWEKRLLKSELALFQNSSPLFDVVQIFKCWWIFLELNSKGLYLSLKRN